MNVLTVPAVAHAFQFLRLTAVVHHQLPWNPNPWWVIHDAPNLNRFEGEHGDSSGRGKYNETQFARVKATQKAVCAERSGLRDWFVPIIVNGAVVATLVTGPFLTARPSGPEVLERWRHLTGKQGHLADPQFALYAQEALSVLVLEGDQASAFERLLLGLSRLMAGERSAVLLKRVYALSEVVQKARRVDYVWGVVDGMIDERAPHRWRSSDLAYVRSRLGLRAAPDQVMVGLISGTVSAGDPIDELVARDAFQRKVVEVASKFGRTLAGRVGERGVVFLSEGTGSKERQKRRAFDLADRVQRMARREFGFSVHFGLAFGSDASSLGSTYEMALGAAEAALHQGVRSLVAEGADFTPSSTLRNLRRELGEIAVDHPELLPVRFERYLETVAAHSGHRLESARTHLDVGFERITEALRRNQSLEGKALTAIQSVLDRVAVTAAKFAELFTAYRRAVADLSDAATKPGSSHKDHSLRRAIEYIHQHYTEPITLQGAARAAGFNATYFSELFHKREQQTFAKYVAGLRVTRAKRLLSTTTFSVTRVAELSGYRSLPYFCRAFERSVGVTPRGYRDGIKKLARSVSGPEKKSVTNRKK